MSKKTDLARALAICAHDGQTDKAGNDYAEHPQHIAAQFEDEARQIVALLHDILEDTFVSAETIGNLFGAEISEAVEAMTHRAGEPYLDYVRRAASNPIARDVKLADLRHNMDLSRLQEVTEADRERLMVKYWPAYAIIAGKDILTDDGHRPARRYNQIINYINNDLNPIDIDPPLGEQEMRDFIRLKRDLDAENARIAKDCEELGIEVWKTGYELAPLDDDWSWDD